MSRFARFAWANLAYNLFVILWGAWVRITGSGAGCGEHWPACNGQVIPRDPTVETMIEFAHRLTSGLALVGVVILVVAARRLYPAGDRVRKAAAWSLALMIVEALLGAGLVIFGFVDRDDSMGRAVAMALHLVNTLFLVGALTATAHFATGARSPLGGAGVDGVLLSSALLAFVVLGASGALSALGSTLFPEVSGLHAHLAPGAHFVLNLAVLHPMLAFFVGTWVVLVALLVAWRRPSRSTIRWALVVVLGTVAQVAAGVLNIYLMAPGWLQLVHLLLADAIWISLVILSLAALAAEPRGGALQSAASRQV